MDTLKRFAQQRSIDFLLLSDAGSKTIDAFGVRNKSASGRTDGIPHPATFVIGQDQVILARLSREGYRERHSVDELISALKNLPSKK